MTRFNVLPGERRLETPLMRAVATGEADWGAERRVSPQCEANEILSL
jgi:hypothetical protein